MSGPKGIDYFIGDGTPSLAGDAFVVIKASEGAGYPPAGAPELAWYPGEQARIRATGALFGAFHFWHPGADNAAQVANFKARANLAPGDLIQLDAEVTDGLDWATVNTRKNDMLSRLKAEFPQCRVLLYTYLDYWNHIDGNVADGLWIADPSAPPGAPRVPHWVIHQYGSSSVDFDIANFSDAAALRTWAATLIPNPPEADMTPDEHRLLANVERMVSYMGRYADAAESGGDKSAFRMIPGLDFLTGSLVSVLNPVAYLEDLIAKVSMASPTVDLAALKGEVLSALTDPSVLKADAHAAAVELHNDLPPS